MRAGTRLGLVAVGLLVIAAVAAIPSAGASTATKGRTCTLSTHEQRHLGASYVQTPLKVRNISCGKAKDVVKDFHTCRHNNGGANGTCPKVDGFTCNQKIIDKGPYQFTAKATCRKGDSKVKQIFIENT
jgi:hypothetical protein